MCEVCEQILGKITPDMTAALVAYAAEAEALGAKAIKLLNDSGFIKMRPDSFTKEQVASGEAARIASLYGMSCVAGFVAGNAVHDQSAVLGSQEVFISAANVGWAMGHINSQTTKN